MEGQGVDYERIKRNIEKMIAQSAPEGDIQTYVASEGVTPAQLRRVPRQQANTPQDFTGGAKQGFDAAVQTANAPGFKPGPGIGDALKIVGNVAMGNPPFKPKSVMDPNQSPEAAPFQVNPGTARMAGAVLSGGSPLISEMAGKGAHIVNRLIGNPSDTGQTLGGSFLESALNIGLQLPFNIKSPLSEGMQKYLGGIDPLQQSIYRSTAKNRAIQRITDLKQAGIEPSLAVTGGATAEGIVNAQSKMPLTANVWNQAMRDFEDQVATSFRKTKETLGAMVEKETAGNAALAGIDTYATRTEKIAVRLYNRVRGINELPVDIAELKTTAYERLTAELQKAGGGDGTTKRVLADILARGIKDPGKVQQVLEAVDKAAGQPPFALSFVMEKSVPFSEARILRSSLLGIGRQQQSLFPAGAQSTGKEFSGLLDELMQKSAAANLNPAAFSRFRKANTFYRERAQNLEAVDRIWKSDSGQVAYARIVSGAADGPAKFDAIARVIPKDQKDEFMAVFLNEIGKESRGAAQNINEAVSPAREFSAPAFMGRWATLPESVKQHVSGAMGQDLRDALDRLARIGGYIKQTRFLSNPSGTAGQSEFMRQVGPFGAGGAAIAAVTGHPGIAASIIAPLGLNYASAKLMTYAPFVEWLAKGAQLNSESLIKRHMARLATIAIANPAVGKDIQNYIDSNRISP